MKWVAADVPVERDVGDVSCSTLRITWACLELGMLGTLAYFKEEEVIS